MYYYKEKKTKKKITLTIEMFLTFDLFDHVAYAPK